MSPEKCPVCGCNDGVERENPSGHTWDVWACGFSTQIPGTSCRNASRLAIERAAEIERLKEEGSRDLVGMRDMQAKYINADHERRALLAEIERLKAMLAPKWTDRRAFLLTERLTGLLRDCNDLDTSSGVMSRLRRIMANAEQLTTAHPDYDDPSFLEFLNQLCLEDRRNQQEK